MSAASPPPPSREPDSPDPDRPDPDQIPQEISAIKHLPKRPGEVGVHVAGRRVAILPAQRAAALGVLVGALWTPTLAARVTDCADRALARARALRLLATHPKSRRQLIDRLVHRGATRPNAESVADELSELGLIDDLALARAVIESELRNRPAGRRALDARLAQRQIEPAVRAAALDEALADRDELADAIAVVKARLGTTRPQDDPTAQARRLVAHLARRGFSSTTAYQAIDRALHHADSP